MTMEELDRWLEQWAQRERRIRERLARELTAIDAAAAGRRPTGPAGRLVTDSPEGPVPAASPGRSAVWTVSVPLAQKAMVCTGSGLSDC